MTKILKVKLSGRNAKLSEPKKKGDAGYDISCNSYRLEWSNISRCFKLHCYTGVSIEPPKMPLLLRMFGFEYVALADQRSNSRKYPFMLANVIGVIDNGYRGEICYTFNVIGSWGDNDSDKKALRTVIEEFTSKPIGQLLFMAVSNNLVVKVVSWLTGTERGGSGFGSTD